MALYFTPITGCEVMFVSHYDTATGTWTIQNIPTFLKYRQVKSPGGYFLRAFRAAGKSPGLSLIRLFDYCTGEFVGVCAGCARRADD